MRGGISFKADRWGAVRQPWLTTLLRTHTLFCTVSLVTSAWRTFSAWGDGGRQGGDDRHRAAWGRAPLESQTHIHRLRQSVNKTRSSGSGKDVEVRGFAHRTDGVEIYSPPPLPRQASRHPWQLGEEPTVLSVTVKGRSALSTGHTVGNHGYRFRTQAQDLQPISAGGSHTLTLIIQGKRKTRQSKTKHVPRVSRRQRGEMFRHSEAWMQTPRGVPVLPWPLSAGSRKRHIHTSCPRSGGAGERRWYLRERRTQVQKNVASQTRF